MFELPDAKRVRREDLFDSTTRDSSPDSTDENEAALLREKLNARLSNMLAVNLEAGPAPPDNDIEMHDDGADEQPPDAEEQFEFRLFSTSAPQKIVIAPDELKEQEGPLISTRPISFYVRGKLSPEELERYRIAAVAGSDVLAESRKRAWGLEVPWRVRTIVVSAGGKVAGRKGSQAAGAAGLEEAAGETAGRKRPGKKRRIALRKKEKAKTEEESKRMTKEEHLKEKKKRLNREKKLKRRQKEREKKAAGKGGSEAGGQDGDESASEAGSD